ncbi:MFS transporter [Devosia geojensis]|uniref:Bcr/CflA family efflux transporter n=1 Tax=Devosia geojensis TaxID=443610 RepID=A0A0F5FVE7_9HYPH|nr:CmlA/FloR family chloramphenicol efflux MFS transporter [Devosia geojensis]KKB12861.1 MFS transporter [Devosia geojensis]
MPTKPQAWGHSLAAALLLMAPFDVLASLAMDIYLPIVPAMPAILDTSPAVVQLTLSLYMVVLGLGQLVFGPLSDRFGRRPVLIGGALLFAGTSLAMAATTSAGLFVALRVLQAAGASAAMVATFATVRDVYAERPEGAVIYGLFGSILAFVPALGPIAGALIADSLGWPAIFLVLGGLALAATANATLRWRETRVPTPAGKRAFGPILTSPAFWTYTLGFAAAMGTFFVFFSTAPRILIERAGLSETVFSFAFATVAIVMIVTTRFAKRFVGKWGIPGSLARGMALLVVGAIVLGLCEAFLEPSMWTVILPMWLVAVGIVFAVSVTANGALAEFGETAGTAVALYFAIQSLFVGVAGTLMVVMLRGDTLWPLVGYCGLMAPLVLVALALLRRRRTAVA